MSLLKRMCAVLLSAVMLAAFLPNVAAAEELPVLFSADDIEVGIGEKIEVTVRASGVTSAGMTAALIGVRYDKRLTFDRAKSSFNAALDGMQTIGTKDIDRGDKFERRFMWAVDEGGVDADFDFFTAVFTLPADVEANTVFDFDLALSSDPKNYLDESGEEVSVAVEGFTVTVRDFESALPLSVGDVTVKGGDSAEIPATLSNLVALRGGLSGARFTLGWSGCAALSSVTASAGTAKIDASGEGSATVSWSGTSPLKADSLTFTCTFDLSAVTDGYESAITPTLPDGAASITSGSGEASGARAELTAGSLKYVDHSISLVPAHSPDCVTDGNSEHYKCEKCGALFSDPDGENGLSAGDVLIAAAGHSLGYVAPTEPTPDADGNIGYWKCSKCLKLFLDENAEFETDAQSVIAVFTPVSGDVNADGAFNARDVELMMRSLVGWTAGNYPALAAFRADLADLSGDGFFTARDVYVAAMKLLEAQGGRTLKAEASSPVLGSDAQAVLGSGEATGVALGDANGDGRLNAKDVTTLMKALVSPDFPPAKFVPAAADVNNDGKVNAKDVTTLMKRLIAPVEYPPLDTGIVFGDFPQTYNDFLSGALFCGDSICEAMELYGMLPDENVVAAGGAGVWNIRREGTYTFKVRGVEYDFDEAVKASSPKRVVLWIGLNDTPASIDYFIGNYTALIEAVRNAAPKAELYIMSVTPIGTESSFAKNYGVTNETIDSFNAALAELAQNEGIPFADVSTVLKDAEENCLADEYANYDGIHLPPKAFPIILRTFLDSIFGENGDAPAEDA